MSSIDGLATYVAVVKELEKIVKVLGGCHAALITVNGSAYAPIKSKYVVVVLINMSYR